MAPAGSEPAHRPPLPPRHPLRGPRRHGLRTDWLRVFILIAALAFCLWVWISLAAVLLAAWRGPGPQDLNEFAKALRAS